MSYESTMPPPKPAPVVLSTAAPIAHWTHTAALISLLAIYAVLGHQRAAQPAAGGSHMLRYVSSITLEWLLLGSVIAGIFHRRAFFQTAFAHRTRSVASAAGLGIAVYCIGFALIATIGSLLYFTPLIHKVNQDVVLGLLPHTSAEFFVWFLVSLTAGVCEEVIFRGYLQQQVEAWTRRPVLAILITGLLFGGLHLYEGAAAIVPLTALGILFGLVVREGRGDLRAVIVAHTLQDFVVALLALARPFAERYRPHP